MLNFKDLFFKPKKKKSNLEGNFFVLEKRIKLNTNLDHFSLVISFVQLVNYIKTQGIVASR